MSFRGQRFAVLGLVIGLSMAVPLGTMPAHAADATSADVQWAQTILKSKGLYNGRANGDLNEPTRDALRAYQKSAGLKQTGQLDAATSGHMLAARQSAAQPTVGNLAGPGGKPQPSQINRNVEPPKPLASPTTRVEAHGSESGVQALGVIGHSAGPSSSEGSRERWQLRPPHGRKRLRPPGLQPPEVPRPESRSRRLLPGPELIRSVRQHPKGCAKLPTRRKPALPRRPGALGGHRRAGRRLRFRRLHLLAQRSAAVPLPHGRVRRG